MTLVNGVQGKGILYTYSLVHLLPRQRVLFFYASKGRGKNLGMFYRLQIKHIGKCVLLVPEGSQKELEDFLVKWNCPFTKQGAVVDAA